MLPKDHPWHSDRIRDLDRLLAQSEPQFGNRTRDREFIGVILGNENRTLIHPKTRRVFISLESRSRDDVEWAQFHLAHESIHLLGPSFSTIVLEEGWASHYSIHNSLMKTDRVAHFRGVIGAIDPRYARALALYEKFLEEGGSMLTVRKHEPYVCNVNGALLKSLFSEMPVELIEALTRPFDENAASPALPP